MTPRTPSESPQEPQINPERLARALYNLRGHHAMDSAHAAEIAVEYERQPAVAPKAMCEEPDCLAKPHRLVVESHAWSVR